MEFGVARAKDQSQSACAERRNAAVFLDIPEFYARVLATTDTA